MIEVCFVYQTLFASFQKSLSTIGVNGINEMIQNFTDGKEDIVSDYGMAFATEILEHIRTKMRAYQEETGNLYNLEATPAEGTTYRFAKRRKNDILILFKREGENIYYTNSSQLPVDYTEDPFEALLLQDNLQCQYTGGTVLHFVYERKTKFGEVS